MTKSIVQTVDTKYGSMMIPTNDVYIGKSLAHYGEYCEAEVRFFQKVLPKGGISIDAGANVGAHTVAMADIVGETGLVYAFEPQPFLNGVLNRNILENGFTNCRTFTIGLGDKSETALFPNLAYRSEVNYGGYSLVTKREKEDYKYLNLPIMRLDDIIDPPIVHLIKADVEGMEMALLRGAEGIIKQFKPVLFLECDWPQDTEEITKFLHARNYECYWFISPLFNPNNHLSAKDDIFGNVKCVNMFCVPEGRNVTGFTHATDAKSHPKYGMERTASYDR